MPVQCVFMNQGVYTKKHGIVAARLATSKIVGNPMTSETYKLDIELKLAIEPINELPTERSEGESYGDPR